MKVENKSTLYFSAYRLKTLEAAIEEANAGERTQSVNDLLTSKAKSMSRVRISAMVNPYDAKTSKASEKLQ